MHEEMIAYVKLHGPVSSEDLAERFLKFKNPDKTVARIAITGILANDRRCSFGEDGLWHGAALPEGNPQARTFSEDRLVAIFLLSLPRVLGGKPLHVSVWTVDARPGLLYDAWLMDPDVLPHDEQEVLKSVRDRPFETIDPGELLMVCEKKIPVFLSPHDLSVFSEIALSPGECTDDALVISRLYRCAEIEVERPLSLETCYAALFGRSPALSYAYKHGEILALCVRELLDRLSEKGIAGVSDLEASEEDQLASFDFSNKGFSLADIQNAPALPGVYGFKTKENAYLYIGKASNLRRRLAGYFRRTEESPEKIARLREEAYGLVTSVCGSELESLIYEYRLIKKHSPALNTQQTVNERKGDFLAIDDCIILLPHADAAADKGMSFWFRKNQKTLLRPFFSDFRDAAGLIVELNKFFFSGNLLPHSEDFPEQEIASRWVKQHRDGLAVVFINRVADAKEACAAMRSLWKDVVERKGSTAYSNDNQITFPPSPLLNKERGEKG
jgi:hypothetical protein